MKEGRTVILNDKGMLLTGSIICILIFALGFMIGFMSCNNVQEKEVTVFTREDLNRISELQRMEDGADIFAYKDKDGNLMIGWNYKGLKWK